VGGEIRNRGSEKRGCEEEGERASGQRTITGPGKFTKLFLSTLRSWDSLVTFETMGWGLARSGAIAPFTDGEMEAERLGDVARVTGEVTFPPQMEVLGESPQQQVLRSPWALLRPRRWLWRADTVT
jgi:hypothetical protein